MQYTILDKKTFTIKGILETIMMEVEDTIMLDGKITIKVLNKPNISKGDYLVNKINTPYLLVLDKIENTKNTIEYELTCNNFDILFNVELEIVNDNLIQSNGVEDFLKNVIDNTFISSTDLLFNKTYLTCICDTHTQLNINIENNNNIYNLMEFISYCRQYYDIYVCYNVLADGIQIVIKKIEKPLLNIDCTIQDVVNFNETFSNEILSRITVISEETLTKTTYYLKKDKSITIDIDDVDREEGTIKTISCSKDINMLQEAIDEFNRNKYKHNIVFDLSKNNKLIEFNDIYTGRKVKVKTRKGDIYESFISKIEFDVVEEFYHVTLGDLKVTLTDKLKGVLKNA